MTCSRPQGRRGAMLPASPDGRWVFCLLTEKILLVAFLVGTLPGIEQECVDGHGSRPPECALPLPR